MASLRLKRSSWIVLAERPEICLSSADGAKMRNPRVSHFLSLEHDFSLFTFQRRFFGHRKILANRVSNVVQSLFFGLALGSAARQPRHPDAEPLVCFLERDCVACFHEKWWRRRELISYCFMITRDLLIRQYCQK